MVAAELQETEREPYPRGRPGVRRQTHEGKKDRVHGWVPTAVADRLNRESAETGNSLSSVVVKYIMLGLEGTADE